MIQAINEKLEDSDSALSVLKETAISDASAPWIKLKYAQLLAEEKSELAIKLTVKTANQGYAPALQFCKEKAPGLI